MTDPLLRRNLSALYGFNFFNSLGITIAAGGMFADLLLLRMGFRTEQFAFAKSAMFLLPGLCYALAAPWLEALRRETLVCGASYALRVAIPLLLPIAGLCTASRSVLFWTAVFVFGCGFTFATFANNSLSVLYRKILPPADYSRYSARLYLLWMAPFSSAMLLAARFFDLFRVLTNRRFFWLMLGLETAFFLFEIPALLCLKRVQVAAGRRMSVSLSWRENLAPLLDRSYRRLLALLVLQGLFVGMMTSFLAVYFLKFVHFSGFGYMLVTQATALAAMALSLCCGKFMDRQGYRAWLALLTAAMLLAMLAFVACPAALPCQLLLLGLVGDGQSGLVGGMRTFMMYTAVTKFARPAAVTSYVAGASLVENLASFSGCIAAGLWYRFLEVRLASDTVTVFRCYFGSCGLLPLFFLALLALGGSWRGPTE